MLLQMLPSWYYLVILIHRRNGNYLHPHRGRNLNSVPKQLSLYYG